jgi:hypothetical protein
LKTINRCGHHLLVHVIQKACHLLCTGLVAVRHLDPNHVVQFVEFVTETEIEIEIVSATVTAIVIVTVKSPDGHVPVRSVDLGHAHLFLDDEKRSDLDHAQRRRLIQKGYHESCSLTA